MAIVEQGGLRVESNSETVEEMQAALDWKPAEPTAEEKPAEATAATAEKPPVAEPVEDESPVTDEDRKRARHDPKAAVKVAKGRMKEAERRATELESRLAAMEAAQRQPPPARPPERAPEPPRAAVAPPQADPNDPEPLLESFAQEADPYSAWIRATARWEGRQEVLKQQRAGIEAQQRQQADTVYRARTTKLTEKFTTYEKGHPEFKTLINPQIAEALRFSTPEQMGTPLGDLVMDSDATPELVVYFSQHPDDFQRVASLHPLLQARELGRIEAGLTAAPTAPRQRPKVSAATPPIQPVGSSPVTTDEPPDDDSGSLGAHKRYWDARDRRIARQR